MKENQAHKIWKTIDRENTQLLFNHSTKQPDNSSQLVAWHCCYVLQATRTLQARAIESTLFQWAWVVGSIISFLRRGISVLSLHFCILCVCTSHIDLEEHFSDLALDVRNTYAKCVNTWKSVLGAHLKNLNGSTNYPCQSIDHYFNIARLQWRSRMPERIAHRCTWCD